MRRLLSVLLLFAAAASQARAQGTITIDGNVSVEGAELRLGDLGRIEGFPPATESRLRQVPLGPSAAPGSSRTFTRDSLRAILLGLGMSGSIESPEIVRVHTAYQEIPGDVLRERVERAIRHQLPWPEESVTLSSWSIPDSIAVPVRARRTFVHFRPGEDFVGRVNADVELIDPDAPSAPGVRRTVSVEITVELSVVVAARDLRRGTPIEETDVRIERRDLRRLPRGTLTDVQAALGQKLARNLPEGMPILAAYVQAEPVVQRGDLVRVQAASDGLELQLDARALRRGSLGQTIEVENPETRSRIRVEITGPGTARLSLPGVGANR